MDPEPSSIFLRQHVLPVQLPERRQPLLDLPHVGGLVDALDEGIAGEQQVLQRGDGLQFVKLAPLPDGVVPDVEHLESFQTFDAFQLVDEIVAYPELFERFSDGFLEVAFMVICA